MPLDLPLGEHHQLPGSPLTLVVCQIRFDANPAATDSATILALHETLGGKEGMYPFLERAQAAPLLQSQAPEMSVVIPQMLSLIHISEPTRLGMISYAVF